MKQRYIINVMMLCIIHVLISMAPTTPEINVYVINNAQDEHGTQHTIFVQIEASIWHQQTGRFAHGEQKVLFGNSAYVGQLDQIEDIETSGDDIYGWIENRIAVNNIKKEVIDNNIHNKDVYVHVITSTNKKYPYYIGSWSWADKDTMLTFDKVKRGFLGKDYAQKIKYICNFDYTKALLAKGYTNLCEYLEQRLQTDVLKGAPSDIKTQEDAVKRIIDGAYEQLKMYTAPKTVKKKRTPTKQNNNNPYPVKTKT